MYRGDRKTSVAFVHLRFWRARPSSLRRVGEGDCFVRDDTANGVHAWTWTTTSAGALGVHYRELSPDEQKRCLASANERWADLKGRPRGASAARTAPHLVPEFRGNLSSPDFSLDLRSPASLDRVRWRCSHCGHEWVSPIQNRAWAGRGVSSVCAGAGERQEPSSVVPGARRIARRGPPASRGRIRRM